MAQVPATPKPRRWALRLWARLLGPGALAARATLQPSERAALALRAQGVPPAPSDPALTVLIPLVGRHHVSDWDAVSDRLAATLRSFTAQDDQDWTVLICGQDRPAKLPDDARIRFVPFTTPVTGNDKWAKLKALCAALPQHVDRDGYVMPFDADDLLAPGIVARMRRQHAAGGYLVTQGYVADEARGRIGLAAPPGLTRPLGKPFWKLCGSCAAFRHLPDDGPGFLAEVTQHEHRMFPYLAALAGRPLAPLPDPAVMYLLNHGENFGARRGRVGFKTRFVERFEVTDPDERARINAAFPR